MNLGPEQSRVLAASIRVQCGEESLELRGEFGRGLSERCIETPWVASHLKEARRILDVGFSLASLEYLGLLIELRRRGVEIEAADIVAPERVRNRYPPDCPVFQTAAPVGPATVGAV